MTGADKDAMLDARFLEIEELKKRARRAEDAAGRVLALAQGALKVSPRGYVYASEIVAALSAGAS